MRFKAAGQNPLMPYGHGLCAGMLFGGIEEGVGDGSAAFDELGCVRQVYVVQLGGRWPRYDHDLNVGGETVEVVPSSGFARQRESADDMVNWSRAECLGFGHLRPAQQDVDLRGARRHGLDNWHVVDHAPVNEPLAPDHYRWEDAGQCARCQEEVPCGTVPKASFGVTR